jgi:hypothetical protein
MARRRIGRDMLVFSSAEAARQSALDKPLELIGWAPVERQLRDISCPAKGEPAWPPLALFKAMLTTVWHDLSDVRLAEAVDDRASLRRFCGFPAHEPTPERTGFMRLRAQLAARGLGGTLFQVVTASSGPGRSRSRPVPLSTPPRLPRPAMPIRRRAGPATSGEGDPQLQGPCRHRCRSRPGRSALRDAGRRS